MNQKKSLLKLKKASLAMQKKDYTSSIRLCKELIKKTTAHIPAQKLLVTNLIALNRFSETEVALEKVIGQINEAESHALVHLLGCNYISLKDYQKALKVLEELFNKTGDSKILLDIALAYFYIPDYESARDVYLKLIELEPNNHQAKFNLYPILLHFKDYKNAWICFHSRLERQEIKEQVHWFAPAWCGESLTGKKILIYPEQGIGDNLSYTSCFSEAVNDALESHIVCDNRLKMLYQHNFPKAIVHSYDDVNNTQSINVALDIQILAGSLTYLYRNSDESFSQQKHLKISHEIVNETQKKLSNHKLRIGLSWFHGRVNDGNAYSMDLEVLLPLLRLEGIEWVNLQFGEYQKEIEELQGKYGIPITHIPECAASGDFNQYGSLITNLDLVISSSNAALMFASRLGVKSWMFLPGEKQGIKPNSNQDSLAVKDVRVFYQKHEKNWDTVVNTFCNEIKALPEYIAKRVRL